MEMNACSVGGVFGWLSSGWNLYKKYWLTWTGMFFCFGLLCFVMQIVPVIGGLAVQFMQPMLLGSFLLAAERASTGVAPSVKDLFAGSPNDNVKKSLYVLGAFSVAANILSAVIMGGAAFGGANLLQGASAVMLGAGVGFSVLLALLISCAALVALWYAIPLVVLGQQKPIDSLKISFFGSFKNFLPLLVFGILSSILVFGGMFAFVIGVFFTAPIAMLAHYYSYKGLFVR